MNAQEKEIVSQLLKIGHFVFHHFNAGNEKIAAGKNPLNELGEVVKWFDF